MFIRFSGQLRGQVTEPFRNPVLEGREIGEQGKNKNKKIIKIIDNRPFIQRPIKGCLCPAANLLRVNRNSELAAYRRIQVAGLHGRVVAQVRRILQVVGAGPVAGLQRGVAA